MENLTYSKSSTYINPRLLAYSTSFKPGIYKTGRNVYSAVGLGVTCPVMIEGRDSVIIIDPGETLDMADRVLIEFRKITVKPVGAVILSGTDPNRWGGMSVYVSEAQASKKAVPVISGSRFLEGLIESKNELLDIRMSRAVYMNGSILKADEKGFVGLGRGSSPDWGDRLIAPNTVVHNGRPLDMSIGGVDLSIFLCPLGGMDELCVFLPNERIMFLGGMLPGETFPDLYSLWGRQRCAKGWYAGIDTIRSYSPLHLVGTYMRPLSGERECMELLTDYRDAIQYTHDQAVRMLNLGHTPEYALSLLGPLPPHLYRRERMGEFSGTFHQGIRGVYSRYSGWFNGEAATLCPVPRPEAAERYISLCGGRESVIRAATNAIAKKEFSWAAELLSLPIRVNHNDWEARRLKATALCELAYLTESAANRSWLLTSAVALSGSFERIPKNALEAAGFPAFSKAILGLNSFTMFSMLKVKLNGPLAADEHLYLIADVADDDTRFVLEIRRGILEIYSGGRLPPLPDETPLIIAPKAMFALLITKEADIEAAVCRREAVCDEAARAAKFFSFFEPFTPFSEMPFWME